jgi:hypothetical protein
MLSTPQLSATSTAPALINDAARFVACCDEPHWASNHLECFVARDQAVRLDHAGSSHGNFTECRAEIAQAAADIGQMMRNFDRNLEI